MIVYFTTLVRQSHRNILKSIGKSTEPSDSGDILGFDRNFLLKQLFRSKIYFVPLVKELKKLNSETKQPNFNSYSKRELVEILETRWLENRKLNPDVITNVLDFNTNDFKI